MQRNSVTATLRFPPFYELCERHPTKKEHAQHYHCDAIRRGRHIFRKPRNHIKIYQRRLNPRIDLDHALSPLPAAVRHLAARTGVLSAAVTGITWDFEDRFESA
jgi:hypothetical protein